MRTNQEFEINTDKSSGYRIFLNVLKYRTPHTHLDYEIGYVMFGNLDLIYDDDVYHLKKGDFMCINPYQIHEFRASDNVQLLFLQVNPSFFMQFYPQIRNMEFIDPVVSCPTDSSGNEYTSLYDSACRNIFSLAQAYMEQRPDYELQCSGLLNLLFFDIMRLAPHANTSNMESTFAHNKALRARRIADYINEHQEEKIALSDIAKSEHLSLSYLSHFFSDNFHMSFQEYLTRLRCEKARNLMLTTDLSLLDISMSCGFSDPKYFKAGFEKTYGSTPKEYRRDFGRQKLSGQQTSMLTTQQILSRQTSLVLLQQYMDRNRIFA